MSISGFGERTGQFTFASGFQTAQLNWIDLIRWKWKCAIVNTIGIEIKCNNMIKIPIEQNSQATASETSISILHSIRLNRNKMEFFY